eukprot:CFRG0980T1
MESFTLDLTVAPAQISDGLSALLHSILFHRAFGEVTPRVVDCKSIDLSFVCCNNADVMSAVENKVKDFCVALDRTANEQEKRAQICVTFSEMREKTNMLMITRQESVVWEEWIIRTQLVMPRNETERHERKQQVEEQILRNTERIIFACNSKYNHIPRVPNSSLFPFPFEIFVPKSKTSWTGGLDYYRKILNDPAAANHSLTR